MTDQELLQPTLDERFDVSRLQKPWDPSRLKFLTFLCWPVGAGVLYTLNYRRLGQPRAALWTAVGTATLTLAFTITVYVMLAGGFEQADRNVLKLVRTAFMVVALVSAVGLSRHQAGPYRAFEMAGGESPSLWKAGTLAVLLNMAVMALILFAAISQLATAQ